MRPTLLYIQDKFKEYNHLFFKDKLPMLPIQIGNAKSSLGGVHFRRKRNLLGKEEFYDFKMTISARFDLPEEEVQDTLIHEMIHYYILYHQVHDTAPHGKAFHQIMEAINQAYGRHITVSHRMTVAAADQDERIKAHYVCVSELEDGRWGVTLAAKTRIFDLWRQMPECFPIKRMRWYGTTDPFFNRFRTALKPKMYLVDGDEIQAHVKNAVELEYDGRTIHPKPEH